MVGICEAKFLEVGSLHLFVSGRGPVGMAGQLIAAATVPSSSTSSSPWPLAGLPWPRIDFRQTLQT